MILKVKKPSLEPSGGGAKLLILVVIWNMISAVLIGFVGFPKSMLYITDAINLFLFLCTISRQKKRRGFPINSVIIWMVMFAFVGLTSAVANKTALPLILWGMRQNFRFFIFFYSCVEFLTEKDFEIILKVIEVIFWISVPLCTYEALVVHYPAGTIVGDMVGGIYYRSGSANAPLNIILVVYSAYITLKCFEGKYSFSRMMMTLFAAIYMAALAELKLFLIEAVIIVVYALFTNKVSWKTAALCIGSLIAANVVIIVFVSINARGRSYYTSDLFSLESMLEYVTRTEGYDGVGDLNRFTAVQTLANRFFSQDTIGLLLGYGLGSAEYSKSIAVLNSPFYMNYSSMHYQYFAHAFMFIETGFLGLFCYSMIFISALKRGAIRLKKTSWKKFYIIMVLIMLLLFVYNTTMRNEFCAYILFAILAIPFARNFDLVSEEKKEGVSVV